MDSTRGYFWARELIEITSGTSAVSDSMESRSRNSPAAADPRGTRSPDALPQPFTKTN
jgi:hypothetical protein